MKILSIYSLILLGSSFAIGFLGIFAEENSTEIKKNVSSVILKLPIIVFLIKYIFNI